MQKKLIPATAILLLLLLVPVVYAASSVSIPYSTFNRAETEEVRYQLDKVYSAPWEAKIDNHLTYNQSIDGARATVKFPANNTNRYPSIYIHMYKDGTLAIDYFDGTSSVTIGKGQYAINDNGAEVKVQMARDYLNVLAYNETSGGYDYVVQKFAVDGWSLGEIDAFGGNYTTYGYVTAGYVSVTVDTGAFIDLGSTTDILIQVVPLVATIAVIGFIVASIKKMTKK